MTTPEEYADRVIKLVNRPYDLKLRRVMEQMFAEAMTEAANVACERLREAATPKPPVSDFVG